jgi:hypothetical protein
VTLGGERLPSGFVAGQTHDISITIGPRRFGSARQVFPEPAEPTADRRLLVRFSASPVQEKEILLPADKAQSSTPATFQLTVPDDSHEVHALIGVYDADQPGRMLQGAVLRGPVVSDIASAQFPTDGMITLDVNPVAADPADAAASRVDASVHVSGGNGVASTAGDSVPIRVPTTKLADKVTTIAEDIVDGAQGMAADGNDPDEFFRDLLYKLAVHGRSLREEMPELLDPDGPFANASHIQVIGAGPSDLLPLELVYDGPPPEEGAHLCPTWREALESGRCDSCENRDPGDPSPDICPLRFWSLSRVIERHAQPDPEGSVTMRVQRTRSTTKLPPLRTAVVGASAQITPADVQSICNQATSLFGPAHTGANWQDWRLKVGMVRPALLATMPHLDTMPNVKVPALELGSTLKAHGALENLDVNPQGDQAGPVVLLIGCNTGATASGLGVFSASFHNHGASVVVSTLGEIITDQAPVVMSTLLDALKEQAATAGGTVGQAVLHARRALLAQQNVMGLLIVASGDADWSLS